MSGILILSNDHLCCVICLSHHKALHGLSLELASIMENFNCSALLLLARNITALIIRADNQYCATMGCALSYSASYSTVKAQ